MKGRGNPQLQQQRQSGRGRGYFGRGGRGPSGIQSSRTGTNPLVGAYLDLPPGKDILPGAVTKWMSKLKEYSMANCDTKVSVIFGQDGTLGDYPVFVAPDHPGPFPDPSEYDIWKIDYADYRKQCNRLEEDKTKLYGIMLGQMSESSKIRVRETLVGEESVTEFDPRKLLQAILATHIGDSTLGLNHQLFNITQKYNNLVMLPYDSLSTYYTNTKSSLSAIEQSYERAGRAGLDENYPEDQMALKFIMGLNHMYDDFKYFYINNLKPWPDTLDQANSEAAKFSPKTKSAAHSNAADYERANAFAFTGRGGRSARGRGYPGGHKGKTTPNGHWVRDGTESPEGGKSEKGSPVAVYTASKSPPHGYKRGPCNNCGKYGHFALECKETPEPMIENYWKESSPKSPGGYKSSPQLGPGKGK